MKRSEMKELIKKELTKTMGSDAAKSVAEDVLHLVEQAGMHPPDAVLNDGQTGKYWDNKWEEEKSLGANLVEALDEALEWQKGNKELRTTVRETGEVKKPKRGHCMISGEPMD